MNWCFTTLQPLRYYDEPSYSIFIAEIAKEVPIPFIVGGGIRTIEDIEKIFDAGGDKVSINSAALKNPSLIEEAANKFKVTTDYPCH